MSVKVLKIPLLSNQLSNLKLFWIPLGDKKQLFHPNDTTPDKRRLKISSSEVKNTKSCLISFQKHAFSHYNFPATTSPSDFLKVTPSLLLHYITVAFSSLCHIILTSNNFTSTSLSLQTSNTPECDPSLTSVSEPKRSQRLWHYSYCANNFIFLLLLLQH